MRTLLLLASVAALGCGESKVSSSDAKSRARYLALGDSFTIGTGSSPERAFPARLVARWRESRCDADLENVAVNGYTTDDVIAEELPAIERFRPTFITVAIGANDIVGGRSPEAYRANVRRILAAARAVSARVVVLPQPDWSRSPVAAEFGSPDVIGEAIARFNAILREEATASGATWADLFPLMQRQAREHMLAPDGLHPSAAAHQAWADAIASTTRPCP